MKSFNTLKIVSAIALTLGFGNAQATTATANLAVGANVAASCSNFTAAGGLPFGAYANNNPTNVDATTTVTATCTTGTAYTIGMSAGLHYNASSYVGWRALANGNSYLGYGVYVNNPGNAPWGDGVNAPLGSVLSATGNGAAQPYTVAGRIPAGQGAVPGGYGDTVVATLTY